MFVPCRGSPKTHSYHAFLPGRLLFIALIFATTTCAAAVHLFPPTPRPVMSNDETTASREQEPNPTQTQTPPTGVPTHDTPKPTDASTHPDDLTETIIGVMEQEKETLYRCLKGHLVGGLRDQIDEIYQETFLATWRWAENWAKGKSDRLEQLPKLLPKMMTVIAVNMAFTAVRRERSKTKATEDAARHNGHSAESLLVELTRRELLEKLMEIIEQLSKKDPDAHKVLLEVRDSGGRPNFKKIGRRLEMSYAKAHAAWRRALRHFRTECERHGIINKEDAAGNGHGGGDV